MRTTGQTITEGEWTRLPGAPCAAAYPDRIHFREGGLYVGSREPEGSYTEWDAGTWKVVAPGRVDISTANDAIRSYDYSVDGGGVLSFRDANGCEFSYRRAG